MELHCCNSSGRCATPLGGLLVTLAANLWLLAAAGSRPAETWALLSVLLLDDKQYWVSQELLRHRPFRVPDLGGRQGCRPGQLGGCQGQDPADLGRCSAGESVGGEGLLAVLLRPLLFSQ